MPNSEDKKTATEPKPAPHPKELSSEYHKAHKQLMLWSTILLIWELVGVDLGKAKDAGGNIGPIVTALKSPQAVPWALLGLVIYFLFKCSVEWAQCNPDRKKMRFASLDFYSAWFVSLVSIILYFGQAIRRAQFANLAGASRIVSLLAILVAAFGVLTLVRSLPDAVIMYVGRQTLRLLQKLKLPKK